MKTIIREFLSFSKTEQRGILLLCGLIILIQATRYFYPWFQSDEFPVSLKYQTVASTWKNHNDSIRNSPPKFHADRGKDNLAEKKLLHPFPFNPNTLDESGWRNLGFTDKEVSSILKFRTKGGRFFKKEDVKKLYCVTTERYAQLEKFIEIPEKGAKRKQPDVYQRKQVTSQFRNVELNSADTVELLALKGIGKYWARRIYRYREQLGGFYSPDQLLEMKGFPDSLYQQAKPQITCDEKLIRKIAVNIIVVEELMKHPYCWYGVGKSIVNYRSKHGPFLNPEELKKIYSLKPETYEKLVHYLTFE